VKNRRWSGGRLLCFRAVRTARPPEKRSYSNVRYGAQGATTEVGRTETNGHAINGRCAQRVQWGRV